MRCSRVGSLMCAAVLCCAICATYTSAESQPELDGNYASQGTGTIAGEPVTEISHWVFVEGKLNSLDQVINIGGTQAGGFVNTQGQLIGFCRYSIDSNLNAPPVPYATLATLGTKVPQFFMISSGETLNPGEGGLCPVGGSQLDTPLEQYIVEPDGRGGGFSYSESGDLGGANPVGTGKHDMSIAGHALKVNKRDR
jgi:hypothetical protein